MDTPATKRLPEPVSGTLSSLVSGPPDERSGTGVGSGRATWGGSAFPGPGADSRRKRETASGVFTPETQHPSSTGGGTSSFSQHPSVLPRTPSRT
jgi:hypothetical protein